MSKHVLNWKRVKFKSQKGHFYQSRIPLVLNRKYNGELLFHILQMPEKKPISFDDAVRLAGQKSLKAPIGRDVGQALWYLDNFVTYISDLGFHIEITGDEFEAVALSDKVA